MRDIKTNYDKIEEIVEPFSKNEMDGSGNFRFYSKLPKISVKQVIALSFCAEAVGMDSENYFLYKLEDHLAAAQITHYNKRRKTPAERNSMLVERLGAELSLEEDVSMVDFILDLFVFFDRSKGHIKSTFG